MSTRLFLGTENPVPALAVACLHLMVAVALVSFSLLLGLAVSSAAWLCDRNGSARRIRDKVEQRAAI